MRDEAKSRIVKMSFVKKYKVELSKTTYLNNLNIVRLTIRTHFSLACPLLITAINKRGLTAQYVRNRVYIRKKRL